MINVGPQSARRGALVVSSNASVTVAEAQAYQQLTDLGWDVKFQLTPDMKPVLWRNVAHSFTNRLGV